ncbi:MAG: Ser-Thr-rich GPI-anchored membrane family protein, partial [Syntrophothermus sp.]
MILFFSAFALLQARSAVSYLRINNQPQESIYPNGAESQSAVTDTNNIVPNGSFELGSGADPDGWNAFRTGNMSMAWSKNMAHTGSSSLNMNNATGGNYPKSYWTSDFINIEPSTAYEFSFWYYITNAIPLVDYSYIQWIDVDVIMYDSGWNQIYSSGFSSAELTPNKWLLRSQQILTQPNAAKIRIKILFDNRQLSYTGNIYVDDFVAKKVNSGAKLILLSPVENEVLPAKGKYEIKWQSENLPIISYGYDCIGSNGWNYFSGINASDGSYKWTVPDTAGYCNVSLSNQQRDYSIVRFCQIARPVLNIDYPSGGEKLQGGSVQTLSWNNTAMNTVRLEYSSNNGTVWNKIADSVKSQDGTYKWTVPTLSSSQCLIRVSDAIYETGTTAVSKLFSINSTQPGDNLVLNSSFENGTGLKPDNWTAVSNGDLVLKWANNFAHAGSYSVMLSSATNPTGNYSYSKWVSDYIDITPSTAYNLSYWIYVDKAPAAGQYIDFSADFYDSLGNYLASNGGSSNYAVGSWFQATSKFMAYSNAKKVRFHMGFYNNGAPYSGTAWFDDFTFRETTPR